MAVKKSAVNPFVKAKNQFRGKAGGKGGNIWDAANFAKRHLQPQDFGKFAEWLDSGPATFGKATLKEPANYFASFVLHRLQSSGYLPRELAWAQSILVLQADKLRSFRSYANEIGGHVYNGNFEKALDIIEDIEKTFGLSLWSLEAKLALLNEKGGLELQKQFASSVREKQRRGLAPFMAYWISERNEEATNPFRYTARVTKMMSESTVATSSRDYVLFKLINILPEEEKRLADVLAIDQAMSAIDLYELSLAICHKILTSECSERATTAAIEFLRVMHITDDVRVKKMLYVFAGQHEVGATLGVNNARIGSLLIEGRFAEAEYAARGELSAGNQDLRIFHLAARAIAYAGLEMQLEEGFSNRLLSDLATVIAKSERWQSSFANLVKVSMNFRHLPLFGDVAGLAYLETLEGLDDWEQYEKGLCTGSKEISPWDILLSPVYSNKEMARLGKEQFSECSYWNLYALANLGDEHANIQLPEFTVPEIRDCALAFAAVRRKDYRSSSGFAQTLRKSSSPSFRREGARLLVLAGVKAGALRQALNDIAFVCVKQEDARHWFSLPWIIRGLRWSDFAECKGELALPIVLDLYLREVEDDQQRSHLRYAYEEFLFANNIRRPSEIADKGQEFPRDQLVYFLRNIAVPPVMDISLEFESSRQVDEERVRVCALLTELDPQHRGEYEEEVFQITKRFRIQDGLRRIDQSRLFVDTAALKRWAERELRDLFERYRSLVKSGYAPKASDFAQALREYLREGAPIPKEFLDIPSGQGDELFVDLVLKLARQFLSNPEHGLEFFLSARIRHGSLSGHMRGPLEARNLVTLRDERSGQYKPNEYWIRRIPSLADGQIVRVQGAFAKFAQGYDDSIERLTKDILQIHGPEKPKGMFSIGVSAHMLHALRDFTVESNTTFDGFTAECFDLFWTLLRKPLEQVRTTLRQEVKSATMKLFNELAADLRSALQPWQYGELLEHVSSAQTEVQLVLDRVADWFLLPDRNPQGGVFQMDQVVDIAIEVTKSARRGFEPIIERQVNAPLDIGVESLASINDCIFIMLDNVYRHSGNNKNPKVNLLVEYAESEGALIVKMLSEVTPDVATSEIDLKLQEIRALAESSDRYLSGAKSEGGSGLLKLRRMTAPRGRDAVSFGLVDGRFFVEAKLPVVVLTEKSAVGAQVF